MNNEQTKQSNEKKAEGKLGVLMPGMGAVATTFMAGVEAVRQQRSQPVGSLTQMGRLPGGAGPGTDPLLKDVLPLASLDDLEFGGWDIFDHDCFESAARAEVLGYQDLQAVRSRLQGIRPMPAVFDKRFVKNLDGPNRKRGTDLWELAQALRDDIKNFMRDRRVDRSVMVWCGSTEVYLEQTPIHQSLRAFEEGLKKSDPSISPSMLYAYAAMTSDVPFANGAPNLTTDIRAMAELAHERRIPLCGKDFKTGQTLMKTALAPAFKARALGLNGWFSTNILGNRDGEVLDDPASFKTKEMSKLSVLESILDKEQYPELYSDYHHKVRINYYPPRGDAKEGWDNIDIFGWLGYPMQIKVDFLCRDSILAAPIVLDLALLLDLAKRSGRRGVQDWMGFYFKAPMTSLGKHAEHDLFAQLDVLNRTLVEML